MSDDALVVRPPEARYTANKADGSKHKVENKTGQRLATKVKCSNNNAYRVRPVYAWLPADGALTLEITRQAHGAKEDRLVIQYLPAANCKTPKEVFARAPHAAAVPHVRLPLIAVEKTDKAVKTAMLPAPAAMKSRAVGPKTAEPGPPPAGKRRK